MPKSLSKESLRAIVQAGLESSANYFGGQLQRRREKALDYYFGYPLGNEVAGRSTVVSTEVRDVIEGMLPGLLRPFTSAGDVVRFDPVGPEDEQAAEQATQYCNHVFKKMNSGFTLLHEGFKDALISGMGCFKVWWDEREEDVVEEYEGLSDEELTLLLDDADIEVVEHTLIIDDGVMPTTTNNVRVKRVRQDGRIRIDTVAPEDFFIDRQARTLEEAQFVAHRVKYHASDLLAMGYSKKQIEKIPSSTNEEFGTETQIREALDDSNFGDGGPSEDAHDPSRREIWLYECYIRADRNGDGISERLKILAAGSGSYEILDIEEVDAFPFAVLIPIPMPHRFFGMSLADQLFDIQEIKTQLWRQLLDNLFSMNHQRSEVVEGQVNMADMLNSRPGGVVRVKAPGMIKPLVTQPAGNQIVAALEYADVVEERRTGYSRLNQGMDVNALGNNTTATGVNALVGMAQQRVEMMARIFAEGGVKNLFRLIFKLVQQHQQREQMLRLRNEWVVIDPRTWASQMDLSISVGLGTGTHDQQLAQISSVLSTQHTIASEMGMGEGSLVTRGNIYRTLIRQAELAGVPAPEAYYTQPPEGPDPQPGPAPADRFMESQIQVEMAKIEAGREKVRTAHEHEMHKLEAEVLIKREEITARMEIEAAKLQASAEAGATKLEVEAALTRERIEADAVAGATTLEVRSEMERERLTRAEFEAQRNQNPMPGPMPDQMPDQMVDIGAG